MNKKTILITGGAGFIGSHVVRVFVNKYPNYNIVNLDALTYAGNLHNLEDIEGKENYTFVKLDITNRDAVNNLFKEHQFDGVIHLAAESHVDRSIHDPIGCAETNVIGTINLLTAARDTWRDGDGYQSKRFYQVSTDEVYGSLKNDGSLFMETTAYDPRSPYSASKASADHFVRAYQHTFNMPIVISNCSNNYGSHQFPEKLIPLFIYNIYEGKKLPVYGNGKNIRDWLYVVDHAKAIDIIYHQGINGETYNIGGLNEWENLDLIKLLCKVMDKKLGKATGTSEQLIEFVKDRPGHDARYAIDASKIQSELGWQPEQTFETGLEETVDWYLSNLDWLQQVTSGEYQKYYDKQYS